MATIKLSTFVFNSDANVTVSLINTAFNAEGDMWDKPTIVDFPVYFDDTFVVAPAIVAESDVQKVKDTITLIEGTDENNTTAIQTARKALARLPKRIFVRSLIRESIIERIDDNGTHTTAAQTVNGKFAENLRANVANEMTATDLQAAVTKSAKKQSNSRPRIVAHTDGYAINAKGRKYQLIKYDLE